MKPFSDYDKIVISNYRELPNGGYVMKILNVELAINKNGGQYLKLGCDIVEGDFANYFMDDYKNQQKEDKKWHCYFFLNIPKDDNSEQDNWTKRKFKRFTLAIAESNPGYTWNWNEQTLKGKLFGGIFNKREYRKSDGSIGKGNNLANFCTVDAIREGSYSVPDDKILQESASASSDTSWMTVDSVDDSDLPFN